MVAVIGIVLGAAGLAAAFGVPLGIERLKRPQLEIVPSTWLPGGPALWTFAAAQIRNKPLTVPFSRVLTREAAQGCVVFIDYYRWGTEEKVIPTLPGRWSSHREPIRLLPRPPSNGSPATTGAADAGPPTITGNPPLAVYEPALDSPEQDIAVSSDGEQIAVAILRHDGEAFGFSNGSYAGHYLFGNPDWKLPRGTYRVVVRVRGSNVEEQQQAFKLEYLSNVFGNFRLQTVA